MQGREKKSARASELSLFVLLYAGRYAQVDCRLLGGGWRVV